MLTLASRIEEAAGSHGAVTFVTGGHVDRVPYALLHDEARATAAVLQSLGIAPGTHVAVLGPTTRPLVTAMQAVWLAGATLVVMPLPMRLGSIEEFQAQTRVRIANADIDLVIVDPDLAPFIERRPGDPRMLLLSDLFEGERRNYITSADFDRPKDNPDALAVLQFTSGSTADPKGVMLPNRTICANLDAICVATSLDPSDDVVVSWLPLYHDMGLVGCLMTPLSTGCGLVLGAPQDFLAAPSRWMEWISEFGGTATAGPNFAYVLATRALAKAEGLNLSRLRIALNGAEPIDPEAVERFIAAAEPFGMSPGAVFPAFGMAELMIAGTFPEPGAGLRTDDVDRRVLETERYAAAVSVDAPNVRRLARLGKPVQGLEIRIVDPETGQVRRDREVGELEIRGTSVTPGYYNRPDLTEALFHDGWLRTGDLAYTVDNRSECEAHGASRHSVLGGGDAEAISGPVPRTSDSRCTCGAGTEMVMCGRIKDVIIVGGRNVFPEDVERAVAAADGVRAGNVIAFGIEANGKEGVVVVAETKADDHATTKRSVVERVRQAVGLPPKDVVLVQPGTLPKTSSGKLQRSLCRDRYLDDELQPVPV